MDLIWRYVLALSIAFTLDTVWNLQIVREAGSDKLPGHHVYVAVAGPVNEEPLLSLDHEGATAMEMQIALAAYDPCNEPKRVRAEEMAANHCPVVPEPCKNSFPVSIKLSVRRSSSPRNGGYFEKTHALPLSVSSR